jgi:hypothetical protein
MNGMYPLTFLQALRKAGVVEEKALQLFQEFANKHNDLSHATNYITTLKEDNSRLKHENEFMLKLIDKHMIGLNEGVDTSP